MDRLPGIDPLVGVTGGTAVPGALPNVGAAAARAGGPPDQSLPPELQALAQSAPPLGLNVEGLGLQGLDGDDYLYPDPASRSQPEGVHGPSEVIDPTAFEWSDEPVAVNPHGKLQRLAEQHGWRIEDWG